MSMRALRLNAYGPPRTALAVETIPKPAFDELSDHVFVRVIAASINPMDYYLAFGHLKGIVDYPMPGGIGYDLSGVVEKVGQKAHGFQPGDEVFGTMAMGSQKGSMAEYVSVSTRYIALKPKAISHEEASCLPIGGLTALSSLALHEGAKDVAWIPAGMGGVGALAIQLAKNYFGFKKVITTVSTDKVPLMKGAVPCVDEVIDYKTANLESSIPLMSVDFILDAVRSPEPFVPFLNMAHPKPTLVTVSKGLPPDKSEEWWEVKMPPAVREVAGKNNRELYESMPRDINFHSVVAKMEAKDLETLGKLAGEGLLKPVIYKVFPLEQGVEAFEEFGSGKAHGKVVIKVADA